VEFNPSQMAERDVYKLMSGAVVPRAIAWVSSVNANGQPNLAPFSYFTVVCAMPPTILFCSGVREGERAMKDTQYNIEQTGEFVVNFVSEALAEQMNITATEVPAEVNEFERAGLTAAPSRVVNVPYVAESPIHFECKLNQIVTISDAPGGGSIIIGTVVHMFISDAIYREGNRIDFRAYQPVGRLAGTGYCRVNDFFDIQRLPPEITKRSETAS
jgi:flavin reductase (DIM6/NTAB) family NADH-FMN oxidoreductase RutF